VLGPVSEGAHDAVTVEAIPAAQIRVVRTMRASSISQRDLIVLLAHGHRTAAKRRG
jgi:hypothetical protein